MPKNYDYEKTIKLKHHERPAKIDSSTGEVIEIKERPNNIPDGKSLLNYERFHMKNDKLAKVAKQTGLLSYEDLGIIDYMCTISEMGTNSLKPLTDDTSTRDLESLFDIPKNRVKKVFDKLFNLGVYLQITYYSAREDQKLTYWVLNPYISWKGKLRNDSMFKHFNDTAITKLIR